MPTPVVDVVEEVDLLGAHDRLVRTSASARSQELHRFVGAVRERLAGLDVGRLWAMSAGEVGESLRDLYAIEAKLAVVRSALLVQAEVVDLPGRDAAVSMTGWLRDRTRPRWPWRRGRSGLPPGWSPIRWCRQADLLPPDP